MRRSLRVSASRWAVARRRLLLAGVFLGDVALSAANDAGPPLWAVPGYAVGVLLVIVLRNRWPIPAFVAALALDAVASGGYVLVIWAAYQAGQAATSRSGVLPLAGAALGWLAVEVLGGPVTPATISNHVVMYLVLIAIPLLTGQYLAQQQRLLRVLGRQNRQLRQNQELLAEQERLRERLRIARDMHDSLGRRISLVSIQAAALQVSSLPPAQRRAVRALADAARSASEELHDLVGSLRAADEDGGPAPDVRAVDALVREFQAAGVAVTLHRRGLPRPLAAEIATTGYRFVEEGLANAAKHAPGQPVVVSVDWEPDSLLLCVENPLPPEREPPSDHGHGIAGLQERARLAGGLVDQSISTSGFRLFALLPLSGVGSEARRAEMAVAEEDPECDGAQRRWPVAVGVTAVVLAFILVPAVLTIGVKVV